MSIYIYIDINIDIGIDIDSVYIYIYKTQRTCIQDIKNIYKIIKEKKLKIVEDEL